MEHRPAREVDIKERLELAKSMQASLDADLSGAGSAYANYMQPLHSALGDLFGLDAIMKKSHIKERDRATLRGPLARYVEAVLQQHPTDAAKEALIESAGTIRALDLIRHTASVIDNEHTMVDLLTEYGNAYIECALELPTADKKERLQESAGDIRALGGKKHGENLTEILESRIDTELYDSLIAFSPQPSWQDLAEGSFDKKQKRGRKR